MNPFKVFGLCAFLLSGCASEPAFQKLRGSSAEPVGVLLVVDPEITNVHLGLTIFGEYGEKLRNNWGLDAHAFEYAKALLRESGYGVNEIRLSDSEIRSIRDEKDWTNSKQNGLSDEWRDRYSQILEKNHLGALVILRERRIYPRGYDHPSYRGLGIFSQTTSDPIIFVSVVADVIGDVPPHRTVSICLAAETFDPGLLRAGLKDVDAVSLEPLHAELRALLERKIRFDLIDSGLVSGSALCPGYSPTTTPTAYRN